MGGGPSVPLEPEHCELDDFVPRFRRSLDLKRSWDPEAKPTHWIYVDAENWERIAAASVADVHSAGACRGGRAVERSAQKDRARVSEPVGDLTLLRLPDVRRMMGLVRSTIYANMNASTFPWNVVVGGAISVSRASAIEEWLRDPA